jgi:hypothetical protein
LSGPRHPREHRDSGHLRPSRNSAQSACEVRSVSVRLRT